MKDKTALSSLHYGVTLNMFKLRMLPWIFNWIHFSIKSYKRNAKNGKLLSGHYIKTFKHSPQAKLIAQSHWACVFQCPNNLSLSSYGKKTLMMGFIGAEENLLMCFYIKLFNNFIKFSFKVDDSRSKMGWSLKWDDSFFGMVSNLVMKNEDDGVGNWFVFFFLIKLGNQRNSEISDFHFLFSFLDFQIL